MYLHGRDDLCGGGRTLLKLKVQTTEDSHKSALGAGLLKRVVS